MGNNKSRAVAANASASASASASTNASTSASVAPLLKSAQVVMLQGNALKRIREHNYRVYAAMASGGSDGNTNLHTYSEYAMIAQESRTSKAGKAAKAGKGAKENPSSADTLYDVWLLQTNGTESTNDIGRKIPTDEHGYFVQLFDANGTLMRDADGADGSTKLRNVAMYGSQLRPVSDMTHISATGETMHGLKEYVCGACQSVSRELDAADLSGVSVSRTSETRHVNPKTVASSVKTWAAELARVTEAQMTSGDGDDGARYYLFRSNDPSNNMLKVVLKTTYDAIDGANKFTLVRENHPVYVRLFMLEANKFAPTAEGLNIINWDNEAAYAEVMKSVKELYSRETFVAEDANLYEPKDMGFLHPYLNQLASNGFVMEILPDIRAMSL